MNIWLQILINFVFSFVSAISFALLINVPHRVLIACGWSGAAGWMVYWFLHRAGFGNMVSNFCGTLLVGILGMIFARIKKCPVTLFNIPGVVPLVPGVPAYLAIRALVMGKFVEAEGLIIRVAIVTAAISMGFMLAQLGSELLSRVRKYCQKHWKRL